MSAPGLVVLSTSVVEVQTDGDNARDLLSPGRTEWSITKQGSTLVRWATIEATCRRKDPKRRADFVRIPERRGTAKARVAVARKLLTLVYYGLRDGEIRCLAEAG